MDIEALFEEPGIQSEIFNAVFSSTEVQKQVDYAKPEMKRINIHSVLSIVILDQYASDARLSLGLPELIELDDFFVEKLRALIC